MIPPAVMAAGAENDSLVRGANSSPAMASRPAPRRSAKASASLNDTVDAGSKVAAKVAGTEARAAGQNNRQRK